MAVSASDRVWPEARPCPDRYLRSLVEYAGPQRDVPLSCFSRSGFTRDAVRYAADVEMALYEPDEAGEPRPVAAHVATDSGTGIYTTLELLPDGWLEPTERRTTSQPVSWRPLVCPTARTAVGATDPRLLATLAFHRDLEPRAPLQFGDRLVGAGDAWLAFEVPTPPGKELYAVQVTPLPVGRQRFDLTRYGARPPIGAFCTSLEAVLGYTSPWRAAAAVDGRFELMVTG